MDPEMEKALERPPLELDLPKGKNTLKVDFDDKNLKSMALVNALIAGDIIETTQAGGVLYVWEADGKFLGILCQYREVTSRRKFNDAVSAIAWFMQTAQEVR